MLSCEDSAVEATKSTRKITGSVQPSTKSVFVCGIFEHEEPSGSCTTDAYNRCLSHSCYRALMIDVQGASKTAAIDIKKQ
jgi:hypothetical protein